MERKGFKQRCTAFMLAVFIIISIFPVSVSADTAAAQWSISADTVIYLVETENFKFSDELKAQVALFSQELYAKGLTKAPLDIVYGDFENSNVTDIVLFLDTDFGFADEAYTITVQTSGQLIIEASDSDGLFYGCRHVIKALIAKTGLSIGTYAYMKPDYPERAFFLDCGRKYYSPDWIEDMIREISWSNMNAIYLHFSEEMGFRLESKTYPWLAGGDNTLCVQGAVNGVAEDNGKYITQDEMRKIAEVAKLYHVEIIPSLDSPGHMNYAVKKYNAQNGTDIGNYFHYNGKTAIVQGSGSEEQKKYSRGIDISNKEAVTFAQNLYKEYAAFFKELGCTKFDIGGDELLGWGTSIDSSVSKWKQLDHWKAYAQERAETEGKSNYSKAVAYDAFMYYMNDIYKLVSSYGYTSVRMWNDDALRSADTGWQKVVTLNKNIEIQYWTPTANSSTNNSTNNVWTYLDEGYKAYNFLNSYNYYVLGQAHDGNGSYEGLTEQRIYENWAPNVFAPYENNKAGLNTEIGDGRIKGSSFCVWCDDPSSETADEVKAGILPFIRVNGAKAWDADINASIKYNTAKDYFDAFGNVPVVDKNTATPKIVHYTMPDISELEAEINACQNADSSLYTEESFSEYQSAADEGQAVITSVRPSAEAVNNALANLLAAKAALVRIIEVDFTQLDEELELFNTFNENDYTEETYKAYKNYAEYAQTLLDSTVVQEDVDKAVKRLQMLREGLRRNDMVAEGEADWFISFAAQSNTVYRGKVFVFTAFVRCDPNVDAFEIYDENGNRVDFVRILWANQAYLKNTKYGAQIRISADVKGEHTYTIYAVSNGKRSPDSRTIKVTVK